MDTPSIVMNVTSIVLAFAALVISWNEVRRSNIVLVSIEDAVAFGSKDCKNNRELYHVLRLQIRNKGISLHDISVSLSFVMQKGGRANIPLVISSVHPRGPDETVPYKSMGEFSRGMVASFVLESHQLRSGGQFLVTELLDPKQQRAKIALYSQDHLAKTFKVSRRTDGLRSAWNYFAYRVNKLFWKKVGTSNEGVDIIHHRQLLPLFNIILSNSVMHFVKEVRRDEGHRGC